MTKILFATLYTEVIEIRTPNEPTEGGSFEMKIELDEQLVKRQRSPKQYFFRVIGIHLRAAIEQTTVPKEFWWVEFEPSVQKWFNLPQRQKLAI